MKTLNLFADKFSTTKIKSLGVSINTYYCGNRLAYKMYVNGKMLFKGTDFKPSSLYNWDDIEANIDLLSFLSVGVHDVDSAYIDNYTPKQLDWANDVQSGLTIREQLNSLVNDASDKSSDYYQEAIKQFKHKTY